MAILPNIEGFIQQALHAFERIVEMGCIVETRVGGHGRNLLWVERVFII
jgi:hypothetical protein